MKMKNWSMKTFLAKLKNEKQSGEYDMNVVYKVVLSCRTVHYSDLKRAIAVTPGNSL